MSDKDPGMFPMPVLSKPKRLPATSLNKHGNNEDDSWEMVMPLPSLTKAPKRNSQAKSSLLDDSDDDDDDDDDGNSSAFDSIFVQRTSLDQQEEQEELLDAGYVCDCMEQRLHSYFGKSGSSVVALGDTSCTFEFGKMSFIANARLEKRDVVLSAMVYSFDTSLSEDEEKKMGNIQRRLPKDSKLAALKDCLVFSTTKPVSLFLRPETSGRFQFELTEYLMAAMGINTDFRERRIVL